MHYCPECGAELEPGDEFCLNCGASLYEDDTPLAKKPEKRFPFKALFIILGIIVVLAAAFLIWFNTPKMRLLRAGVGTVNDLKKLDTIDSFTKACENGSIEAEADMTEFLSSLAFLDAVDAKAHARVGMDKSSCSVYLDAGASVQGMSALDAETWISPEFLTIRSSALLGKESFAVDLAELMTDKNITELSMLCSRILTAEPEKAALRLYNSAFNSGKVYSEKFEDTQVVHLTIDSDALAKILSDFCSWGLKLDPVKKYAGDFDPSCIYSLADMLPADSPLRLRFYINKDVRVDRVEASLKNSIAAIRIAPDTREPENILISAKSNDNTIECDYRIKEDSDKKLSASVTAEINETEPVSASISWNKDSGDFEIKSEGKRITPKMTLRFNEDDKIPELPENARKVSLMNPDDVNEVAGALDQNVSALVNELGLFMPFSIRDVVNSFAADFAGSLREQLKSLRSEGMSAKQIKEMTESISESVAESVAQSVSESIGESVAESVEAEAAALAESIAKQYAASAPASAASSAAAPSPVETTPAETEPARKSVAGTYQLQDGAAYGISATIAMTDSGTYSFAIYSVFLNLSDTGTYTMDASGNLKFATKLPYQFTAKYDFQDSIYLTIPQYGTFTLKRVK